MRASLLAIFTLLAFVAPARAELVRPYQGLAGGEPITDLRPLEIWLDAQTGLEPSRDVELAWEAAIGRMRSRDYENAVSFLASVAEEASANPLVAFVYAIALMTTERDALAAANLRGAVGLFPGWRDLTIALPEFFGDHADYTAVRKRLLKAYDLAPGGNVDPDTLALLGTLFYFDGEMPKSQVALEQLLVRSPTDRVANHFLGALRRMMRDDAGGGPGPAPAGTWRAEPPQDPFEQGASMLYAGKYQLALERFAEVVARDPAHPYAFFEMAQALFGLGRFHQAAAAVRIGLDHNQAILASGLVRRQFYDDPTRLDREFEALEQAVQESSSDPELMLLLGFQLCFDDQPDRAVMAMRLVDRMKPGDPHAALVLEAVLQRGAARAPEEGGEEPAPAGPVPAQPVEEEEQGLRTRSRLQDETRLAADTTERPVAEASDALGRFRSGDRKGAYAAYLQRMISGARSPGNSAEERIADEAAFVLAAVESGKLALAMVLCDDMLRQHSQPDALPLDLRDLYENEGDLARTISLVEELTLVYPDDLPATTLLGFMLHYSGARERARTVFASIASRDPSNTAARTFLETAASAEDQRR